MKKSTRPSLESIFLNLAQNLALRSKDTKLKVGCVITDLELKHILGIGYNAGAALQSDERASQEIGASGLIHAEVNALIKNQNPYIDKAAFITHFPCPTCAKILVNSKIKVLHYLEDYGIMKDSRAILQKAGVNIIKGEAYHNAKRVQDSRKRRKTNT